MITRLNIGGPARHAIVLDRELPSRGFPSTLVSGREDTREGTLAPDPSSTWIRIPSLHRSVAPWSDVRALAAIKRILRARRPQIVHTHMAKAGALARLAAARDGVPIRVHTFHGHVLEGYFPKQVERMFLRAERRLARRTTALIAVSARVRDDLLALGIGRPEQWHVIPEVVELDHLLDSRLDRGEARRRLRVSPEGPVIGIVGRLVPIKDHDTFFRAAVQVARARPDVTFVVAGDGELRASLEATAHQLLGDRIRFLGWVDDLEALYRSLDVLVLTSRNEGLPFVVLEAGAAGRPVVATDVGGVPEAVRAGTTGEIVPPKNPHAVARVITALIDHPDRARDMGVSARRWVADRFSLDRVVDDITYLYRELLGRHGP